MSCSSLLSTDVFIPAQSFFNYVLLAVVYGPFLACREGDNQITKVMRQRGWKYFILAVIDVEANYLVVKAYHFTTVTSVQVRDLASSNSHQCTGT